MVPYEWKIILKLYIYGQFYVNPISQIPILCESLQPVNSYSLTNKQKVSLYPNHLQMIISELTN